MTTVDAEQLHRTAVVADTHNDLLMAVVARPPDHWGAYFRENWLPQLRDGGVDVQVLPVFVDDAYRPEGALRQTLRMIEAAHRLVEDNADEVALCLDGATLDSTLDSGRIALVLALEGCPGIDADVELFGTMHRLGVRIASLTHFGRTALADGSGEDGTGGRLTRAGVAAVAEMEHLGILFDVSHLGAASVEHVLELATRPVIATHSSARAQRDHHRNLSDSQLKNIAAGGGVICVNFYAGFLDPSVHTIDRLVDHIEHVASVAGLEHVGIGPDFLEGDRGASCGRRGATTSWSKASTSATASPGWKVRGGCPGHRRSAPTWVRHRGCVQRDGWQRRAAAARRARPTR